MRQKIPNSQSVNPEDFCLRGFGEAIAPLVCVWQEGSLRRLFSQQLVRGGNI